MKGDFANVASIFVAKMVKELHRLQCGVMTDDESIPSNDADWKRIRITWPTEWIMVEEAARALANGVIGTEVVERYHDAVDFDEEPPAGPVLKFYNPQKRSAVPNLQIGALLIIESPLIVRCWSDIDPNHGKMFSADVIFERLER